MNELKELLDQEQALLDKITSNRQTSRELVKSNKGVRGELKEVRSKIINLVVKETSEGRTLYSVVKEALGVIDGRYNKIYDLINKQ